MVRFGTLTHRHGGRSATTAHSHKEKSVLPEEVEHRSLTMLREQLIKIGCKVVSRGRYVTFQMAEVAVLR